MKRRIYRNMEKLNIVDGYIDKISIVGDMKRDGNIPIPLKFLGNSLDPRIRGPYLVNKGNYSRNVDFVTADSTAKIEMNDRKVDVSDFRIDFNPAKCSEDDMKFIFHLLSMVKNKRCTGIDLCINFHEYIMDYELVDRRQRQERTYKGAGGRLETLYRGAERSDNYIKFYNKKVQQKDVKYRDIEHEWCRLEETIQGKKAENFHEWEWFKDIKLVSGNPIFPEDISPIDELVIEGILSKPEKMDKLKPTHKKKIKKLMQELKYPDEFNVCEEIKKTDIVSEATSVIRKLLT